MFFDTSWHIIVSKEFCCKISLLHFVLLARVQLDAVSGDVGVPAFEPLPLKFLFDVGHLGFFVERGDQGEGEPAATSPRQLGVQLPLAEAH